jgi:hypothetical protein
MRRSGWRKTRSALLKTTLLATELLVFGSLIWRAVSAMLQPAQLPSLPATLTHPVIKSSPELTLLKQWD